jgi:hypothetical protein
VGGGDSGERACDLSGHVGGGLAPGEAAEGGVGESYGGVEVGSGDGAEGEDQGDQGGSGCEGVAEQREGDVPGGEALGHDARADDGAEQEGGADELGGEAAREGGGHFVPMLPSSFLRAGWSSVARGKARKRPMRRSSVVKASWKAWAISASVPCTAAGSGMPQ